MWQRSELPPLAELPDEFEDDPALFDPSPEWFVPGLKPSLREDAAPPPERNKNAEQSRMQPQTIPCSARANFRKEKCHVVALQRF